jgi:DNA (cytosine-5)-methyltransferase 1
MKHLDLFAGIGGFSLAAKWMNWQTVGWCEIKPFNQRVLRYYYPEAKGHEDITTTDFRGYRGAVDLITGGAPCQPFSAAGKRKGTEDERHLWPQMLRAIREVLPRWVVFENVYGFVSWSDGLVFEQVQADMEAAGYEVWAYVLPACGVEAPQERIRVWIVGYRAESEISQKGKMGSTVTDVAECCESGKLRQGSEQGQSRGCDCKNRNIADSMCQGLGCNSRHKQEKHKSSCHNQPPDWAKFPTVSPICQRDDGFSSRLSGITFPAWRNGSIEGLGNAIVPQVALQIFKAIEEYEQLSRQS